MKNNKIAQIDWLKNLISLALLAGCVIFYLFIKAKEWDARSDVGELLAQILIEIIAALVVVVFVYYFFVRKGISSESRLINEIALKIRGELGDHKFHYQAEANKLFDLKEKLKSSKEVLVSGYSCRFLAAEFKNELKEAILNKVNIKILVIEPQSSAAQLLVDNQSYKAFQEIEADLAELKERLTGIIQEIRSIKKNKKIDQFELRYLSWIPSCSMIISIPKDEKFSSLRLKIYAPSGNVPIPQIMTHMIIGEAKHKELFEYFYDEFYRMWRKAKPDTDLTLK